MNTAMRWGVFGMAAALLATPAAGCAGVPREPLALPPVGDSFAAPYDAVWDATLKNLGVLRLRVADKGTGRIETEPFPFAFVVGRRPGRPHQAVRLASREPDRIRLAQDGSDGRATQVLWIAMLITVRRAGDNRTDVLVEPRVHDAFLMLFTPGPTNSPWGDLFAKIRSSLGGR